ncbi:hypothetical protein HPB47_024615 [Ixodes persulcatus]|uniref:Uncharacterized protein n=1 Tax=Ixodes persulcatus TaxID=34615 RepID=A0AC60Q5N1_IXOPE|nr:hypothetical protein HPB47_024615 [Ixodes persulcatus]
MIFQKIGCTFMPWVGFITMVAVLVHQDSVVTVGQERWGRKMEASHNLNEQKDEMSGPHGIRSKGYTSEDESRLRKLGADFVKTNRGGLITFHGPGQLVAYPILYLGSFNEQKSMRWYVCQLEKTVVDTCAHFGLRADTTQETGVWIGDNKIAAIGVHGSRYVTTHGVALNCSTDLDWFGHIVPCGLQGKGVTSLSRELGRELGVAEASPVFLDSFRRHFGCQTVPDWPPSPL